MPTGPETSSAKTIHLGFALIPIVFLIGALALSIIGFDQKAHIPLVLATAVAAVVAAGHRYRWQQILAGMIHGINLTMGAILILMTIGMMIGTWILGGVVPAMIYYGLSLLSPTIFLVATLLICSVVSLGTGSSWSTVGTVGVALLAIGKGLGISEAIVAGAIISGSYLGDKMSPLSDTTNLAPAVAGADVFTHIRHMVYTTVPSYTLALVLYAVIGSQFSAESINAPQIDLMLSSLEAKYQLNPILLFAPVAVIVMVVLRLPPLPALLGGTALGAVFAMALQHGSLADVFRAAYAGCVADTGVELVDDLLTRGGLTSMMNTVALIICALSFGGVMERTGMLSSIANALLKLAKGTGSLVATTVFSCIAMNIVAAEQYMAIVIPGRMYKDAFEARGLHPKNLSRCLEDSATLTSALVPWNSCGAFMFGTIGVSPLAYLPYAFLNMANPIISLFYGFTGLTMEKIEAQSRPAVDGDSSAGSNPTGRPE